MQYSRNRWYVLLLLVLAGLAACDDSTTEPVDEAQVLVDYLEANRDYSVHGGYIMTASDVRTALVAAPDDYYVIDIRAAADYAAGHIEGAVNVALGDLPDHLAAMSPAPSSYDKVFLICYSGQSAAYSTGLLRALGHENVFSMKFGMSAWHTDFAGSWNNNVSNERVTQFVTTASPAKNDPGALPALSTGFEDGGSIVEARVEQMFAAGFADAKITDDQVFLSPEDYYIVNYWASADYLGLGHIPGAIMYEPATTPWLFSNDLTTLPTDKTIVVYCYTGQTSAYVTAYLKTLGYDAKSLVFGANSMIHDVMAAAQNHAWGTGAIMDYEYDAMN